MSTTTVMAAEVNLLGALEDRGLRKTFARSAVISRIERASDAFTAEQLCRELPNVGRATVYRTIRHLVDAGALCKLPILYGAPMYGHRMEIFITCSSCLTRADAKSGEISAND